MNMLGINTFIDDGLARGSALLTAPKFCVFSFISTHPEVLHYEMQYVDQLRYSMAFLHNDLASPVGQHLVAVLHAGGHSWGQDGHGLANDGPGLHGMGLQQAVEDLNRAHTHTPYLIW